MRPPSTELLRALRIVYQLPSPSNVCRAKAARPTVSLYPARTLTTSARLCAAAPRPQSRPQNSPTRPDPPRINPRAPKTHDRGPVSEEETQTDFSKMDILANAGAVTPANSIDACTNDGFHLNNGQQTEGGLGLVLLDGEAFVWTPWDTSVGNSAEGFGRLLDKRGIINFPQSSLGVLELVYPKPDLLIVGTGRKLWMLGKETRKYLSETLGIRVDVMDTGNAAAAYNLLATERGITEVAALMIPDGFRGI